MPSPHVHIPFNRIPEYIDFIKKNELNLEIYFGSGILDAITEDEIISLKNSLDYNPSLSIHAPFMDLSPGAVDFRIREVTLERFHQALDIAELLKSKTVVFHSGYEKWKYALNIELWLEKSLITWQIINKKAIDIGVKIAIENIFEDEPTNLRLLMKNMNSENFGICFDTGHCNLFSRVSLESWMEALNPYVIELHLHDNNRTSDQHLPIGEGSFDFDTFFRLLRNKECIFTIEAHSPENVMKSLEYIKNL
ncbi:MAG: sugar phosphate isomerase/epimerase family protein [Nitrospirota bacterium]